MRILELMGMSSTKYGGIEKFNKKLVDIEINQMILCLSMLKSLNVMII